MYGKNILRQTVYYITLSPNKPTRVILFLHFILIQVFHLYIPYKVRYDYDIIVLYLTMSPSTITLSNRGFPGSAGRTGKISWAWRMRCLLHTFIIWFWNRISMSTKSCWILLHHSWSCHIYTSPVFICLLTFGSSFNSIYYVKNLFFPVDEMYVTSGKI